MRDGLLTVHKHVSRLNINIQFHHVSKRQCAALTVAPAYPTQQFDVERLRFEPATSALNAIHERDERVDIQDVR